MNKIDKHFVSEIDKKMAEFNATHSKSAAQAAEFKKYQGVYQLRDVPTDKPVDKDALWD
ncbi:MAG: hypothetical protein NTZ67_05625 [Gammaproteobacteria bacterium]|nr:hypothetical protein [Gammaproteobacteria bacterium]